MKKIPTLFKRLFEGGNIVSVLPETADGLEYILTDEEVIPTVKWDGSCCALIGGKFYKRYDAKRGKTPPPGTHRDIKTAGRRKTVHRFLPDESSLSTAFQFFICKICCSHPAFTDLYKSFSCE